MSCLEQETIRAIGIDVCQRGLGFAVLENNSRFVDWGVRKVNFKKPQSVLGVLSDLIQLYAPGIVVLEDCSQRTRKRGRTPDIIFRCGAAAANLGCTVIFCSNERVKQHFTRWGAKNKHQTARAIAARFPALSHQLPPPRKIWMSEDYRTAIFDAAAFVLTAAEAAPPPQAT